MSHQELRWHEWLLKTRSKISMDIELIEYLWRPDLEGNLLFLSSVHTFQWATTDNQWQGTMNFKCSTGDDVDWIRYVCTTFVIQGDPGVFDDLDDASIESMITFEQIDGHGRTKR